MPPQAWARGPASSRSLQICFHLARDFVGLQPQTAASAPPWEAQRSLPRLTSALRTAPPGLAAWILTQSPRQSAVALDVRQARPCTLPQAGWPRSPPRCVSQGGACLRGAQPRGPAPARVPSPSQLLAAPRASGASPARRAAQGVEWEKAEWEEQGGKRIPDPPRPSAAPISPAAHPGIGHWHLLPRV